MEQDLNQYLVDSILKDRRRERFWRMFRFFFWVAVIAAVILFAIFGDKSDKTSGLDVKKPYVTLVRLTGEIGPGAQLSAKNTVPLLKKAFKNKKAKGVILLMNSPGGTPVQASIIHDKIVSLKKQYKKKVVVVAEDMLASGGYLIATAADKIYVGKDTLTGAIGVLMSSFGVTGTMQKYGVTRRLYTAGVHKARMDPFSPVKPGDVAKIHRVLAQIHTDFIDYVKQGRGKRLVGDPKKLFSGDFWTGKRAVQLGLADGTGDLWTVMKKEFGVEQFKSYAPAMGVLQDMISGAQSALQHVGLSAFTPVQPMQAELR